MLHHPESSEIRALFNNENPAEVWSRASEIIQKISPDYDFSTLSMAFRDVVGLFHGGYPGYRKIATPYHNLHHTMDVFICAVRLLHGIHVSGNRLSDDEVTIGAVAALMHDVGYARQIGDEEGSGAQYTKIHVSRSIAFMSVYMGEKKWPEAWAAPLQCAIRSTDPAVPLPRIPFPDERARMLGHVVATADLVGQMADRAYLEKLLFLYSEFKEACLGDFRSAQDLLRRTKEFYETTGKKLDEELGGTYAFLGKHFKDWYGSESNFYMESIAKNMAYLSDIVKRDEAEYFQMLKRGGIVAQVESLAPTLFI